MAHVAINYAFLPTIHIYVYNQLDNVSRKKNNNIILNFKKT